jgi:hypothetical protein
MLAFKFMQHHYLFDPVYAVDVLNHMWATEPVGTTSIILTSLGLTFTLLFKLMDFAWDIYKERARQGKLKIELVAEQVMSGQLAVGAIISNTGKEPIVVRDIGHARPRLLGVEFVRVSPKDNPLPHSLNARELVRIEVREDETDLNTLCATFRVKDSLGKVWEAPDTEIRKVRRQLKVLRATLAHLSRESTLQSRVNLEQLQSASPLSTQN